MLPQNEQILAQRMLVTRDCGLTFVLFLRRNAWRYLLLTSVYGATFALALYYRQGPMASFAFGLLAGILLRDFAWMRAARTVWPFTRRVTDWDKVQWLAEGREVD
jgi:hypothetical protein